MNTSETSTVELEEKIQALSLLPSLTTELKWAKTFNEMWDISIPLAMAFQLGYIDELTDSGVDIIESCFSAMSLTLGMTPQEMLAEIQSYKEE